MESDLRPRNASAPPSAATACLTRSTDFCARAGCARLAASSRAAIGKRYRMVGPPLTLCGNATFCRGRRSSGSLLMEHDLFPKTGDHFSGSCSVELQESRRVAAHDLLALGGSHPDLVHHVEPRALERDQRRRVGSEQEMVGADGFKAHFGGERRVARRVEIHHAKIVTWRMLDQHRLVG